MKIVITYPPLNNQKGCPTLGQNRQFQYFKEPTFIYPIVPAQAATLLKEAGYEVIWNDCIAGGYNYKEFLGFIQKEKPVLVVFESKTPVINELWRIIEAIKGLFPHGQAPKIALFGDHVTALPEESLQNSKVDFVLTGGDYDFLLLNLCSCLTPNPATKRGGSANHYAGTYNLRPELLEPGIYYRDNGQIKNTGKFKLNHDLNCLPFIDRELTQWRLYAYKNGNYKLTPGTYIMSARDCWWGKCTFCSWPQLYPQFRARKVENVLNEVEGLIKNNQIREVMDDSGCFPAGDWLRDFCNGVIKRGINKKIYFDCNMRFGELSPDEFSLMKKANFRLLLFGLESANQNTLDRINKNLKVQRIIEDCKSASRAGLKPHITIMFGYPWETYEEALNTLKLGTWLLKKGYCYTMQATIVIPYPGTPLFDECKERAQLRTLNWDDYDMKQAVMRTEIADSKMNELVQGMYGVSFNPEFILRKILSLRDIDDLKYYLRALKKVLGHIVDFKQSGHGI